MRILKIVTNDDCVFYSDQWNYGLVEALEHQAEKRHSGVYSMELVLMTLEEYNAIPATVESGQLFAIDPLAATPAEPSEGGTHD